MNAPKQENEDAVGGSALSAGLEVHEEDPVIKALAIALGSLSDMLRYATEDNFMDGYEAASSAARGIGAIHKALEHMNL